MLSALTLLLALAAPAQADCEAMTIPALNEHLSSALAALDQHRYLDFERERRAAEAGFDCLGDVLRDQTLANVHLVWTARAWLDGDRDRLLAGLRGLRVVHPGFSLPAGWSEGNGQLEELYREASSEGPGREERLPGRLVVDGLMAAWYIPVERAAVVQVRNAEGGWSTWYVEPSEPTTTWLRANRAVEAAPEDALAPVPVP